MKALNKKVITFRALKKFYSLKNQPNKKSFNGLTYKKATFKQLNRELKRVLKLDKRAIIKTITVGRNKLAKNGFMLSSGDLLRTITVKANTEVEIEQKLKREIDILNKTIKFTGDYLTEWNIHDESTPLSAFIDEDEDFLNVGLTNKEAPKLEGNYYNYAQDSKQNKCVLDYFKSNYGKSNIDILKILKRDPPQESMCSWTKRNLDKDDEYNFLYLEHDKLTKIENEEAYEEAYESSISDVPISLNEIQIVAKHLRVSLMVLDRLNNKIIHNIVEEDVRNHHLRTMIFMVANNHLYPYTENVRHSILHGKKQEYNIEFGNTQFDIKNNQIRHNIFMNKSEFSYKIFTDHMKNTRLDNKEHHKYIVDKIEELKKIIKSSTSSKNDKINASSSLRTLHLKYSLAVYIKDDDNLNDIFININKKTNKFYPTSCRSGYISKIYLDNDFFHIIGNTDCERCNNILKTEKLEFTNDTFKTVGKKIFNKMDKLTNYKSDYAPNFILPILRPVMYSSHARFSNKIVEYDINKCFTACAEFNQESFYKFTPFDTPDIFTKEDKILLETNKLRQGLYYVIPDNINNPLFLDGNGWKSLITIKEAIKSGYGFKITHKLLPNKRNYIKKDLFKKFIKKVYTNHGKDGNNAKDMINIFIGILGQHKNKTKVKRSFCTNSVEDITYYLKSYENCTVSILAKDLFIVKFHEKIDNTSNYLTIYNQIIESSRVLLNKTFKKLGNQWHNVINICVDSILYNKPLRKLRISNNRGQLKCTPTNDLYEKYKIKLQTKPTELYLDDYNEHDESLILTKNIDLYNGDFPPKTQFINTRIFDITPFTQYMKIIKTASDDMANIDITGSFLLSGGPGNGKSYTTIEIIKKLVNDGNKILLTATTHKAKANEHFIKNIININKDIAKEYIIKPSTIHSVLKLGTGGFDKTYAQFEKIDYLIIDECSMITKNIYLHLRNIKVLYPNLKIILVGDYDQLEPVEFDDVYYEFENTYFLAWLMDFKAIFLTKNMRSNNIMSDILDNIRNNKPIDIKQFKRRISPLNLVFTNKLKDGLNYEISKFAIKRCTKSVKVNLTNSTVKEFKICVGMPVVSYHNITRKINKYYNNQEFIIRDINKETIKLMAKVEQEEITLPITEFAKNFDLGYAMTVHRSQGMTIRTKYTIHEYNKMGRKMKYVAISRTSNIQNIRMM